MVTRVQYDEHLTAPRSWWLIAAGLGLSAGLMLLPIGPLAMLGGMVVGGALAAAGVSAYGSVRVRVIAGSLVAGGARIPLSALGEAEALDAEQARAWRTHKADPRAHMVLRAYVPTALRVRITDPDDPTPYLYVSTRDPEGLLAALRAARAEAADGER
ncbi:DUF3093 domain-containing protein [Streptomyces sp. AJS327]|uniref:DUF3093 domain-containing protein n=1 Tax=Streptomyces sp. AJS327 TaxID=2545265 RepID=UPI0015DD5814|nr:DUF3093 domain-containing protein [Streptomyces sp. AJS327]MBA0052006.1 DUF3093 domain-containing protein [Streptomyces sp. AJS327]